jgi:hypothetical protein
MSFPVEDKGYEDDVIRDVAAHWRAKIHWIPIDGIPLFAEQEKRVAVRDDIMAHSFESIVRALMRGTRAIGARVALEGVGGDHLFHVSDSVLADHLFFGRWSALFQGWRARRNWHWRQFARACVLPHLSDDTLLWIGGLRGRPIRNYWDAPAPSWVRPLEVVATEKRPHSLKRPDESAAGFEIRRLVTTPHLARVLSWNHGFGLEEGVQVRTPMLDDVSLSSLPHDRSANATMGAANPRCCCADRCGICFRTPSSGPSLTKWVQWLGTSAARLNC